MTFPKARPIVFGLIFLAWIGFLFYLVVSAPTDILSRPQLLASPVCIVGKVRDDDGKANPEIEIVEFLHGPKFKKVGGKITLRDLASVSKAQGYRGPGQYILPLSEGPDGALELAAVPRQTARTGRFPASHADLTIAGIFSRRLFRRIPASDAQERAIAAKSAGYEVWLDEVNLRIYPLNDGTRQQAETIFKVR